MAVNLSHQTLNSKLAFLMIKILTHHIYALNFHMNIEHLLRLDFSEYLTVANHPLIHSNFANSKQV